MKEIICKNIFDSYNGNLELLIQDYKFISNFFLKNQETLENESEDLNQLNFAAISVIFEYGDGSLIFEILQREKTVLDQECDCKYLFENLRVKCQSNQINKIFILITTVVQLPVECRNYLQQLKSNQTEILFNYFLSSDQKINEDRLIIYHPEILKIRYSLNQQQIPLNDLYKENQSKYCFIFNCSSEKNHIIEQKQSKKEEQILD